MLISQKHGGRTGRISARTPEQFSSVQENINGAPVVDHIITSEILWQNPFHISNLFDLEATESSIV